MKSVVSQCDNDGSLGTRESKIFISSFNRRRCAQSTSCVTLLLHGIVDAVKEDVDLYLVSSSAAGLSSCSSSLDEFQGRAFQVGYWILVKV